MIQKFVDKFMENKPKIEASFRAKLPSEYKDIVQVTIENIITPDEYGEPDPKRIHEINDGDYQGTLVYVIAANSYQPNTYWSVFVSYGSCSGCDTLQSVLDYRDEITDKKISGLMTLALHIVQRLKLMDCEPV